MRIYLLQYFCATSQLIYVVKSCVIEQRVTDCWKVSQVYHNVFSCCVLTREYRLNPCEPLPPSTLTPCPTKRLPVLLQRIVGFLLPKQLLLQLCAFSSMSFFCFVPMLFQLFASLHTRCSHCLLFALRISHQPCLPPSSLWTFFFPSCFSCIDFVQFDFSMVLTKIGSGRQESTNSESAHKGKVGEGERISGDSEIDEVTPRWKRKIVSEVKRCIEVVLCCTCVWKEFDVNLFSLGPCVINLPFYTFILNISLKCVCVRSVREWERKTSTYLQV